MADYGRKGLENLLRRKINKSNEISVCRLSNQDCERVQYSVSGVLEEYGFESTNETHFRPVLGHIS
jgi:hypothetical protein